MSRPILPRFARSSLAFPTPLDACHAGYCLAFHADVLTRDKPKNVWVGSRLAAVSTTTSCLENVCWAS